MSISSSLSSVIACYHGRSSRRRSIAPSATTAAGTIIAAGFVLVVTSTVMPAKDNRTSDIRVKEREYASFVTMTSTRRRTEGVSTTATVAQAPSRISTAKCCYMATPGLSSNTYLATSSASQRTSEVESEDAANTTVMASPKPASWIRRRLLYPFLGISMPVPRLITSQDPSLMLPPLALQQRQRDEQELQKLMQRAAKLQQQAQQPTTNNSITEQQKQHAALGQELFEVIYGKGVTPQQREDFLVRYGCTGWTDEIIQYLLQLAEHRGMIEIGAGHGQWARALNDAYRKTQVQDYHNQNLLVRLLPNASTKQFDLVLAYDDQSNLPLNTHIYNQYTQPHHDFFGKVHVLQPGQLPLILQSWKCRGRILLLVYPPPGPMAANVLKTYLDANYKWNDTIVYVGEGRGDANADDTFFDILMNGDWILLKELPVLRPPGNKGYETMLVLQKKELDAG